MRVAVEAIETLDRYLGFFYEKGYPGRACLRSGWVREGAIHEDRARVEQLRRRLEAVRDAVALTEAASLPPSDYEVTW